MVLPIRVVNSRGVLENCVDIHACRPSHILELAGDMFVFIVPTQTNSTIKFLSPVH